MRPIGPNTSFTSTAQGPVSLVGTLGWKLQDTDGDVVIARATTGITEVDPGIYAAVRTSPSTEGDYLIVWDTGGGTPLYAYEELTVSTSAALNAWTGYVSAADIRAWSHVDWAELNYPAPTPPAEDFLDVLIQRAESDIFFGTGKKVADIEPGDVLVPIAQECIQKLVEYRAGAYQHENIETGFDFGEVKSFSASPYSETRRGLAEGQGVRHPVPAINRLMNMIATGQVFGFGTDVPAVLGEDPVRWNVGSEIMGPDIPLVGPFGPVRAPWDFSGWGFW